MSSNDRGLAKRLKTFQERFGGNAPICCPEIRAKIEATNLKKYGVKTPFESKSIRDKCKQTIRERYGVDNAGSLPHVVLKREHTIRDHTFERYKTVLLQTHNIQLISTKDQFINDHVLAFQCNNCNHVWTQNRTIPQLVTCPNCATTNIVYYNRQGLIDYITSIYQGKILFDYKIDNYSIDVFIPQYNIGIRWVDNWYDNELYRDPDYNRQLSDVFKNHNIRVIHIFEYQWKINRIKLQYLIRGALHDFDNVIYARNCTIKPIDQKTFRQFLEDNYLGSYVNASTRLGLFHNDCLIAVVAFGKGRYQRNVIELYRYCVKLGYRIIGGLSKLIRNSTFDRVFSYVDKSRYTGNGYIASGFKVIGETVACGYVYSNGITTHDRISCQKHRQLKKFGRYDPKLTESENMAINGYYRVFDCGALRMEWTR